MIQTADASFDVVVAGAVSAVQIRWVLDQSGQFTEGPTEPVDLVLKRPVYA